MTHPALAGFHSPVQSWFEASFQSPTRAQELGWPAIQAGESTLILAPTGSGKTLAAFMVAIDRLMFEPVPAPAQRCRVLYISPLKALAVDVERNLRAPLIGVKRQSESLGIAAHTPEVFIRTGDTPSRERTAFARHPADILITTPESLYLMLTSAARDALRSVTWVIIDEIHAMVNTKRGAHLALSLERLAEITAVPFQRIGLSATVRPLDEVARFLGGFEESDIRLGPDEGLIEASESLLAEDDRQAARTVEFERRARPVQIVDAGRSKPLELVVEVPVEDMARLGEVVEIPTGPAAQAEARTSIWPAMHPLILNLIRTHRSTLIFVNSRRLAERLAAALNELAGEEIVHAHHGSIAREQRLLIEDELKAGKLPAMVATSSLELGIDMGAIDLVIQVEAPPSVASGMQRIGRAGHQIDAASKGVILPKYRGDLLACAALTERMMQGAVEEMHYPRNPLDILAQQIVSMVSLDDWRLEDLERLVRRAAPFSDLPHSLLEQVLDMLSGRYPSDDFAELRPRITWDRIQGRLHSREGARRVAIANGGTIPDRGLYGVFLAGAERGKGRVGELDEEMVFESKAGDVFLLGASSWRIEEITHDRVIVTPAAGQPGKMPFWHGESAGRPLEFGRAIGVLTRRLRELSRKQGIDLLVERHCLTELAAENLVDYLEAQAESSGMVPDDRTIVVESNMDEMGDWRVCILSPFGGKVHAPWAMAIGAMLRDSGGHDTDILWTDDGIVVRFAETDDPPAAELLLPDPDEVEDLVIRQLGIGGGGAHAATQGAPVNALFASRFREAAARALLLPRRHPGQRQPLWQQRKRAADLLRATAKYGSFPIVLETFRECLKDVFDMPALVELLGQIRSRDVRVVPITTRVPSPFAASLLFNYVANFIYEGDAPLAERRAQALMVDPAQLRELLGEAELRELLSSEVMAALEVALQHLTTERAARHPDALHDLLIRLGDLTTQEASLRTALPADAGNWLRQLERDRRIISVNIAGEPRWAAVEDAARYRDALGVPLPPGLPQAFLETAVDPLEELTARYARTHGPFTVQDISARFGLGVGPVTSALYKLQSSGRVVEGEFRPGASGREWCDAGVLRMLRQKSLAQLRHEVEPVDPAALARLYLAWQGIGAQRPSSALVEIVEQLQDASLPASVLETQILPARLASYDPRELDLLVASGEVIWVGCEPLGQHDGRISLYLAEHAPAFLGNPPQNPPNERIHQAIREHLQQRGASFFAQIVQSAGSVFPPDVVTALWDLVWSGEVTNDTLQPLRAFVSPPKPGRAADERRRAGGIRPRPAGGGIRRSTPPEASGRWSLVSSLVYGVPPPAERQMARAQQFLDRFGILTREAVQAAGIEGGFSAVYGVLRAMEESGRVRRGYFIAGLGATQFAVPGAVDRLRMLRETPETMDSHLIAATDPANPYGSALPWPESEGRRPTRTAGAHVILIDGGLVAWLSRDLTSMLTFLAQAPEREPFEAAIEIARVLADQVYPGRRRAVLIEEVDGRDPATTPMAQALEQAGFKRVEKGFLKRL